MTYVFYINRFIIPALNHFILMINAQLRSNRPKIIVIFKAAYELLNDMFS